MSETFQNAQMKFVSSKVKSSRFRRPTKRMFDSLLAQIIPDGAFAQSGFVKEESGDLFGVVRQKIVFDQPLNSLKNERSSFVRQLDFFRSTSFGFSLNFFLPKAICLVCAVRLLKFESENKDFLSLLFGSLKTSASILVSALREPWNA